MDSIFEISRLVGFEFPEEIVKTLRIKGSKCDKEVEEILSSPVLPPLSYTNDCMRFVTLLRYWRGKDIAKECAKAYRRVKGKRDEEEFWWGVQELLYRAKADCRVIRRYLRRVRRMWRKIKKSRERINEIASVWILPPYVELLAGLLPPKSALRVVKRGVDVLLDKSGHFARFGVSTFDLIYGLFEGLYRLSLSYKTPKEIEKTLIEFIDFYVGMVEISLVGGKDSVDPPLDLALRKNPD